jgi:hypothetical protein
MDDFPSPNLLPPGEFDVKLRIRYVFSMMLLITKSRTKKYVEQCNATWCCLIMDFREHHRIDSSVVLKLLGGAELGKTLRG